MAESGYSALVRSMSAPRSSSAKSFTLHIPRNALKIAGIAFGVGILLFVLVWLTGRDKEFFRADPVRTLAGNGPGGAIAGAAGRGRS